jgi:ubiquinone/menaquinone biosynthesis C-methylase UbiE
MRKKYEGVLNVFKFNWHFYLIVSLAILSLMIGQHWVTVPYSILLQIVCVLLILSTLTSLLVTAYVYDFSDLYQMNWLNRIDTKNDQVILNLNAGFDETSVLLRQQFERSKLLVADFYNPEKHTEVSIQRARMAKPPYPNTLQISTDHLPLQDSSVDMIFGILSLHEIRSKREQTIFFKELQRVLDVDGKIIVIEHLRNLPNFLAYTIGFFHFHSRRKWLSSFREAGITLSDQFSITPFVTVFTLEK